MLNSKWLKTIILKLADKNNNIEIDWIKDSINSKKIETNYFAFNNFIFSFLS